MVSVALRATVTGESSTIRCNEYDVDGDVGGEDDGAQGATSMMASEMRCETTAHTIAT
jgi:hypothetical protein